MTLWQFIQLLIVAVGIFAFVFGYIIGNYHGKKNQELYQKRKLTEMQQAEAMAKYFGGKL